ncbi:DUF1150 family protein [Rhizobium herbae]|uniref:DUF1150 family protein n=1 Tax=Rhizobium herbae TaxID=508661 RepID=A0ABS4EU78_9HYPH|nr:DUF1150 family protein [Rhizobium herbae]MBP1861497.1 hypothetical protein [Rhizobium herbae]
MEADRTEFPASTDHTGYIRKVDVEGDTMWALVDFDGDPICIANRKSSIYFFARNHDIKVVLLH